MNLKKLSKLFTRRKTSTGADITIWDEMEPEESAMVQALNSRSPGGFWKNLLLVIKEGAEKFMEKFYSKYGHKSIADCASTTAAFDDISMLAAKEVQNFWAYNGQETSTRYIDVTGLGYLDPLGTEQSKAIMERWFDFYKKSLEPTMAHLKIVRPKKDDEDESKYSTMIEKRAYDVLGSFLPAGARTNASCHMELRNWDEKLSYMIHHPLSEISSLAKETFDGLCERYPSTFIKKKVYEESENYRKNFMEKFSYERANLEYKNSYNALRKGFDFSTNFQHNIILEKHYGDLLENRPVKTDVPKIVNECGSYRIEFLIDFRSHRDLQRQRSALQRVPLLTYFNGFEEWYLEQLPEDVRNEALRLIDEQIIAIKGLDCNDEISQYYLAMGFKVLDVFTVPLADLIYIIELRTATTVHPTARKIALQMYSGLKDSLSNVKLDIPIYADESEDDFDIKRADQDLFMGEKRISEITK